MIKNAVTRFSIEKPKQLTLTLVLLTLVLGALIIRVRVDTDPENMLSETEPVRIFHNEMKKEFALNDFVVLGVVNETHPDGVFNKKTLSGVHELTEFVKNMHDPDNPNIKVVTRNLIAPGSVDAIEQAGPGQVRFDWLMAKPPESDADVARIRRLVMENPLFAGTLVSEDEKALGIYIPVSEKDFSGQVRKNLLEKIDTFPTDNNDLFYITGLPTAEDTFGEEMFVQMAISAPLAMLAILILMFLFFKKIQLVISPMIVAMMSIFCSMGLLIGTGNTLHIMSSMIPIFLMPIAVVDSVHILSEFFDAYPSIRDRKKTILHVMDQLFIPMLYTSLTSSAGFASLALTPIPPVQAFGIFVAVGIMLAWVFTILFVPAYIMMMKEKSLENFGNRGAHGESGSFLSSQLQKIGRLTYHRSKLILVVALMTAVLAGYGISKIRINDNPVKWFAKNHPIRQADRVLNEHFAGTYEAYLVLGNAGKEPDTRTAATWIKDAVNGSADIDLSVRNEALTILSSIEIPADNPGKLYADLTDRWEAKMDAAPDETYDAWADIVDLIDGVKNRKEIFKDPEMLKYVASLQEHLLQTGIVGKSNAVTDVVKTVHRELFEGESERFRIPDTRGAVAECLISFQNSHKPDDLWHFVTPDYTKANIWIQLKNGDNQVMEAVIDDVETFLAQNPPPTALTHQWAGLTYLNVVWQNKMVFGMGKAFLSSFVVVLIMMTILFRSFIWGVLAMVPLSVTIAFIYGIIGLAGKEYDMPVAVLSSLTLGLAVDFAIHFLERARRTHQKTGSWKASVGEMFEEPARAITRNVIVIAIGFTPLLAAPLIPYKTVGIFLAGIMVVSGIGTMLILPALITLFDTCLFRNIKRLPRLPDKNS